MQDLYHQQYHDHEEEVPADQTKKRLLELPRFGVPLKGLFEGIYRVP